MDLEITVRAMPLPEFVYSSFKKQGIINEFIKARMAVILRGKILYDDHRRIFYFFLYYLLSDGGILPFYFYLYSCKQ